MYSNTKIRDLDLRSNEKILDTTTIKTVTELEGICWDKYAGKNDKNWIRYIKYPISWVELDRICFLARTSSKIKLFHSMGELFIKFL